MFLISKVEIQGFWGKYKAVAALHDDVNIFIGRNGSGKTTFMDLLQGVLRVEPRILAAVDFESVTISLHDGETLQNLIVTKRDASGAPSNFMQFKIGTKGYKLPNYPREYYDEVFRRPIRNSSLEEFIKIRREIVELVNISNLSVHRAAYEDIYEEDDYVPRARVRRVPIEQRLEVLVRNLTKYQLSLAEQANQVSTKFQREVLATMLYDEKFDNFDIGAAHGADLSKEKEDLSRAYGELGALNEDVLRRIDKHVSAMSHSLSVVQEIAGAKNTKGLRMEDLMPLVLFKRTQHIINLSLEAQNKKLEIFQPINKFVSIVGQFMEDKEVIVGQNGDLIIRKEDKIIAISDLSSGEKQLLILLIETLLQKNGPFIFLADEPELSLHIDWQAQIISSIRELNPNSQIIVATHSPEIAGGWKDNVIDMGNVIDA